MANRYYLFFELLGTPLRMDIIELLKEKGKLNVGEICKALNQEQSKISHNLKKLQLCNVVNVSKEIAETHYGLASCLYLKGRLEDAIEEFKKTLRIDPTYEKAEIGLKNCKNDLEKSSGKKVKHIGSDWNIHYLTAGYLIDNKDFNKAEDELRIASSMNTEFGKIHTCIAFCLQEQGKIDEAIKNDDDFLQTDHTVLNYRIDHYPELLDRQNYDAWEAEGALTLRDKAKTKVDNILAEHSGVTLSGKVAKAINSVIEE